MLEKQLCFLEGLEEELPCSVVPLEDLNIFARQDLELIKGHYPSFSELRRKFWRFDVFYQYDNDCASEEVNELLNSYFFDMWGDDYDCGEGEITQEEEEELRRRLDEGNILCFRCFNICLRDDGIYLGLLRFPKQRRNRVFIENFDSESEEGGVLNRTRYLEKIADIAYRCFLC